MSLVPSPEPRTLFVLGASSDIGGALIRSLDGEALSVLAHCNRSEGKLRALGEELRTVRMTPIAADLSDAAQVESLLARLRAFEPAPARVVLLAAPRLTVVRFKDARWEDFQHEIDVQLRAAVLVLGTLLPAMARNRDGKVVFVLSSVTRGVPAAAMAPYSTAKHALLGLMRSLAAEYAPRRININAVSPSMVDTAFLQRLDPRHAEIVAAQAPWRRNATAGEVAGVIRFLLSPEAGYMTGVEVPVAGGTAF